jgi:CHAT domain-containing protein
LEDGRLDVLLVVNPTRDLAGAEQEGQRLKARLEKASGVRVQALNGSEATRRALLRAFGSGEFDIVHYAGHAFFDPMNRAQSGLLCHGQEVLTGNDLASAGNLPSLIVFNACESARVRSAGRVRAPGRAADLSANAGLAESLLRGGLANFVGTYWPVGDSSALEFASTFYTKLLEGAPVGSALVASRERVRAIGSADWADYVHYGDYDFRLRIR